MLRRGLAVSRLTASTSRRLLSSDRVGSIATKSSQGYKQGYRRLAPKSKGAGAPPARRSAHGDASLRVCAQMMGNAHSAPELAAALRARFGAGAVQLFEGSAAYGGAAQHLEPGEVSLIDGVVHLSAPASGDDAPHGSPPASVFFFTGTTDADDFSGSTCVSVWWGAEPAFQDGLLRDLRAAPALLPKGGGLLGRLGFGLGGARRPAKLTRQQQLDRLAVPRVTLRWNLGARSELIKEADARSRRSRAGSGGSGELAEIVVDAAVDARSRVLDQLTFSQALQRHMKLLLLEEEMERILSSVKRTVRQGLGGASILRGFLPQALGGIDSGARTLQRLLLMREFNFDSDLMSTPDWLWEQPAREAIYDEMVAEYEIGDRIEAINQQLDYAERTVQSLKDDAQHHHSTFLEYAIVLLISFEVLVEMHALGWIQVPTFSKLAAGDAKEEDAPPMPHGEASALPRYGGHGRN
jgi:hypothetical protein